MAEMRKEQKVIQGLWAIGIILEALKLFFTYAKVFMTIQLTLILPLAVLSTVTSEYLLYRNLPNPVPSSSETTTLPNGLNSNFVSLSGEGIEIENFGLVFAIALVACLVAIFASIIAEAMMNISSSTIIYAVGLHYSGQSISFKDVFHAAIPRLWMRLTITKIYKILLFYGMVMGLGLGCVLFIHHGWWVGVAALVLLFIIGSFCVGVVCTLAGGVSVFEKEYGWAALRRAANLLKGRVIVAILYQLLWMALLWMVPSGSLGGFLLTFQRQSSTEHYYSLSNMAVFVLSTLLQISFKSFVWQMQALCDGVQYASFKAYHDEDLTDSISIARAYERIGSGVNDDMEQGGQKVEFFL